MKKSIIGAVLGMASLGLVLAGCGGGDNGGGSSSGDEKQTITYGLWDKAQAPVYEEIAKDFEKENPNITVKFEITPWAQYWTKLETAVTGQNAPDVFWMNIPRVVDYIDNGVLEPLDDLAFDKDKIHDQYLQAYTGADSKLYGVPKDFDTNGLWYNKKMFDDAGIAYPDDTWTWDTWKEVAQKLTDKDKGIYGMAVPATWQGGYYETIYQNEGSPFSEDGKASGFTEPATIEGVEFWYDFVKDGSGTPIELITNTNQTELMLSGKVAMAVDGSYQTPVFFEEEYGKENIDVAPLPKGKVRATTSNSLANVVYAGSKHKEAAKKWVEYLTTEESMKHVAESGTVIPVYEGSQEAWVNAYPDKNLQVFVDAADYAVALPNYKNSSAAIAIEQDSINKAWTGEITVKEACEEIAKKADEILKQ
jgi:ABC-type sugar transport system, periplasmic component